VVVVVVVVVVPVLSLSASRGCGGVGGRRCRCRRRRRRRRRPRPVAVPVLSSSPSCRRPRLVVVPVLLSSPSCRRRYPLVVFVVGRRPRRRSCRRRLRCPLVVWFVEHPRATLRAGARSGAVGFAPSSFSLVLTPRLPCEQGLAAVGVSSCRHLVVTIELEPKKEEKK